jgi:hypothetical protein
MLATAEFGLSEQYDFVLSLLLLGDRPRFEINEDEPEDTFGRFMKS